MKALQYGIRQSNSKAPNGSPYNVLLTVLSDSSIRANHTNGATNQDGTYYFLSLDGVTNWFLGATIMGNGTTADITGLTENTNYYVKAAHFKRSKLSGYSNISLTATLSNELRSKFAVWYKPTEYTASYFIDKIGVQGRESLTESGIAGVIHPGRAISYDGAKSQYSRITGNLPENFKLSNNSLTFSYWIKMDSNPASYSAVFGTELSVANGYYYAQVSSGGILYTAINDSITQHIIQSDIVITDGVWHHVFVVINKAGLFSVYLDNRLQGTSIDISTKSFGNITSVFKIGGDTGKFSGIKYIRDFRVWSSAITSNSDRLTVYNGNYLTGCTSWWMYEEGKEGNIYPIKDCIGNNHLENYAFDETSLITGSWASLLNKFGYSQAEYIGSDILTGAGTFSNAGLWSPLATRFEVTGGAASYLAKDDLGNVLLCNNVINIPIGSVVRFSFSVTEGANPVIGFRNQAGQILITAASRPIGTHNIIIKMPFAATKISVYAGGAANGAFKIDNLTVSIYESGIVLPKMNANPPTTDTILRELTFINQAKYNLIKVDADTVKMPNNIIELVDATNKISVNDWYSAGIANNIYFSNIKYQGGVQYYKNGELIIIKSNINISDSEDLLIRNYLGINNSFNNSINTWIIAGQSNAYANCVVADQTIPGYSNELTDGYIWNPINNEFELVTPGVNSAFDRPPAPMNNFGAEVSFLKDLSLSTGTPQYIIKLAEGSTTLQQVAGEDWSEKSTGELLDELKVLISDANANMLTNNKYIRIRGIIWIQGESDTSYCYYYYKNLVNFFANLKYFCDSINVENNVEYKRILPIISRMSINQAYNQTLKTQIRTAQSDFIAKSEGILIDTDTYVLKVDNVHFTGDSIIQLGKDAAAAVKLIYN